MKISANQLSMAISKIKSVVHGYPKQNEDLTVDMDFVHADPGKGVMVDALILTASAPVDGDKEDKEVRMTIELYPESYKEEPRVTKTETFKLRNSY